MSEYQSFEDRLVAKRAEEKAKQEQARKDQEAARAKRDAERKYTNPVRREEAQTRYKELLSPSQPAARPKTAQPSSSGKPIEFYAWKEGEVGKIKILTEGDFEAI